MPRLEGREGLESREGGERLEGLQAERGGIVYTPLNSRPADPLTLSYFPFTGAGCGAVNSALKSRRNVTTDCARC